MLLPYVGTNENVIVNEAIIIEMAVVISIIAHYTDLENTFTTACFRMKDR